MPAAKKRQSRLAGNKRPLLIGAFVLIAVIIAYGAYVGSEMWRMARYQAETDNTLHYRDTVYRASDNLRRPMVVDFTTGRHSIPDARVIVPATPELDLTYGIYDNDGIQTIFLSSNQGIESAKVSYGNLSGSNQGEMLASVMQGVAQVQACRRQVTIMLTPRGRTSVAPEGGKYERQTELTLRDGRTAAIYRDVECQSSADTLLTAAKNITSF